MRCEKNWDAETVMEKCLCNRPDDVRHAKRVRDLCEVIIEQLPEEWKQGIDKQLLIDAALLHDVGKEQEKITGQAHNEIVPQVLRALDVEDEKLFEVIRVHKGSFVPRCAEREAAILRIADKIDKLNKVGEKLEKKSKKPDKMIEKFKDAVEKYQKALGKVERYFGEAGKAEAQTIARACNIVFEEVRDNVGRKMQN